MFGNRQRKARERALAASRARLMADIEEGEARLREGSRSKVLREAVDHGRRMLALGDLAVG